MPPVAPDGGSERNCQLAGKHSPFIHSTSVPSEIESPMDGTSMVTLPLAAESHRREAWNATLPRIAEAATTLAGCTRAPAAATRAGSACGDRSRATQGNERKCALSLGDRNGGGLAGRRCRTSRPGRGSHARNRNTASVSTRLRAGNRYRTRPRSMALCFPLAGRRMPRERKALKAAQRRPSARRIALSTPCAAFPPQAPVSRPQLRPAQWTSTKHSPRPRERRCERTGRAWLVSARCWQREAEGAGLTIDKALDCC